MKDKSNTRAYPALIEMIIGDGLMKLTKSIKKLDKYSHRLKSGKAQEIKPKHVEKVIKKLTAKKQLLNEEFAEATKSSKQERLKGKLLMIEEQLGRADWLMGKIRSL